MANLLPADKPLAQAIADGLLSNSSTATSSRADPSSVVAATEALTVVLREMGLILGEA